MINWCFTGSREVRTPPGVLILQSNNSLGQWDQPSTAVQENTGDGVAFYFCPRSRGQQDGQISAICVCFSCKMGVLPTEGLAGKL